MWRSSADLLTSTHIPAALRNKFSPPRTNVRPIDAHLQQKFVPLFHRNVPFAHGGLWPIDSRSVGSYSTDVLHEILPKRRLLSPHVDLIRDELQHRSLLAIAEQTEKLNSATEKLITETTHVQREVGLLTASQERLEGLTKTLRWLTCVLVALTFLATVVPIGIEVWKAYHHEPLIEQTLAPPQ